jgi:uncharacterized membrane-anchored protein YitT (DUF2179 family)
MGKIVTLIIGIVLMAIGVVWFFQGIGSLAGSPMTGVSFWAYAGGVVFVIGVVLLLLGLRKRRAPR